MSVIHLNMTATPPDPYARCEDGCTHDLGQGVLIEDLLGGDGPYPPVWPESTTGGWLLERVLRTRPITEEPAA